MSIEVSETEAYWRLAKGLGNPRRIRDAQLRIAFLTLSIVLSSPLSFAYITLHLRFVLLTEALIILTTVVLYVLACDPLPPCAGTVREWLRGMAPARNANAPTSLRGMTTASSCQSRRGCVVRHRFPSCPPDGHSSRILRDRLDQHVRVTVALGPPAARLARRAGARGPALPFDINRARV